MPFTFCDPLCENLSLILGVNRLIFAERVTFYIAPLHKSWGAGHIIQTAGDQRKEDGVEPFLSFSFFFECFVCVFVFFSHPFSGRLEPPVNVGNEEESSH